MSELEKTFSRILALSIKDGKDAAAMGLKLMEETGEFGEAINFELGNLPHKKMKEPLIGEAADVIQNVVAILAKIYSESSNEEIIESLNYFLEKKTDKWERIMFKSRTAKDKQKIESKRIRRVPKPE